MTIVRCNRCGLTGTDRRKISCGRCKHSVDQLGYNPHVPVDYSTLSTSETPPITETYVSPVFNGGGGSFGGGGASDSWSDSSSSSSSSDSGGGGGD